MTTTQEKIKVLEKYLDSIGCDWHTDRNKDEVVLNEVWSNCAKLSDLLFLVNEKTDNLFIKSESRPVPYEDFEDEYLIIYKEVDCSDEKHLENLENDAVTPWQISEWQDYRRLYKKFIGGINV